MTEYVIRKPRFADVSIIVEPLILGEIVRCRDCEYEDEPWNCAAPYYAEPDGFCFWAKRRAVDA